MNKWIILAGYAVIVATSQMLWLTFASIDSLTATLMHTSTDNIAILSLIFPLTYIILAIPMSRWLDRSFAPALITGAFLSAAGGVMRLADPYSFLFQAVSQTVTSIGQPLILGSLSIVAVYYFDEKDRPLAISVGSLSIFIGIIAATAIGPLIFFNLGYIPMLIIESLPGVAGLILVSVSLRHTETGVREQFETSKFKYTHFHYKLAAMLFVGMGVFDALESWLQPMMAAFNGGNYAPDILTIMTVAGIFGAAIVPQLASRRGKRKLVVSVIIVASLISLLAAGFSRNIFLIGGLLAIEGFFLLAGLPIIIEWAESATPPQHQGRVTNLLMLTGNAGGLVMIAMGYVTQPMGSDITSLGLVAFILLLIPVLAITPATMHKAVSLPT